MEMYYMPLEYIERDKGLRNILLCSTAKAQRVWY